MSIFNGFSKRLFGAFSQNYVGLSFRKKTLRGRVETMATSLSQKNLIFKSLCTLSGENFSRASKMAAIVGRLFHKKGRLALHARLGKKKSILLPGTKPLRSIHVNIIIRPGHLPDGFVAGQRVELSTDASWLLLLLGWMRWNFSYRLLCLRQSGDAAGRSNCRIL